jgi:hypothetical protein
MMARNRSTRLVTALFVASLLLWTPDPVVAKRQIPDDNLAYPVLITLKSRGGTIGSGSGIFLHSGDAIYLVTAKHVLAPGLPDPKTGVIKFPDLTVELLSYSKDLPNPGRNLFSLDFAKLRDTGDVKAHQTRDVAIIKLETILKLGDDSFMASSIPGVVLRETSGTGILAASRDTVRTLDQVHVGNDAMLYGYPASLGLPDNRQFDPLRPLLRRGLIAGADPQRHSLVIDAPVYRGNSGGPVFEIDQDFPTTHYNLVGISTEFVPLVESAPDFFIQLNSGYSLAEPMDFVLELIPPQ